MQNNKLYLRTLQDTVRKRKFTIARIEMLFPDIDINEIEFKRSCSSGFFYRDRKYVWKSSIKKSQEHRLRFYRDTPVYKSYEIKESDTFIENMIAIGNIDDIVEHLYDSVLELIRTPDIFDFIFPRMIEETDDVFIMEKLPDTYREVTVDDFGNKDIMSAVLAMKEKYYGMAKEDIFITENDLPPPRYFLCPDFDSNNYMVNTDTNDIKFVDETGFEYLETAHPKTQVRLVSVDSFHNLDVVDISSNRILKNISVKSREELEASYDDWLPNCGCDIERTFHPSPL
jgi:hypothetical protein